MNDNTIDQALWNRVCNFFRSAIGDSGTAEDLTQELLLKFVRNGSLDRFVTEVTPTPECLWSFVRKCAQRFLVNHFRSQGRNRNLAWSRRVSLDAPEGEGFAPVTESHSEEVALEEIEAAAERGERKLEAEFAQRGKGAIFAALRPHLSEVGADLSPTYQRLTGELQLSAVNARVCLSRARNRFRELVRAELQIAA